MAVDQVLPPALPYSFGRPARVSARVSLGQAYAERLRAFTTGPMGASAGPD